MKRFFIIMVFIILFPAFVGAQNQQAEIDSLVKGLRTAGRNWTDYSNPLIKIGESAVPGLIKSATDKSLPQWNRRVSMETLNQIHSQLWVKPALQILFDEDEIPNLRNRVIGGLRGFDLSEKKTELWNLYNKAENQFYKSNLAILLLTADTALAYKAFRELYLTQDGHIQRYALQNLIQLRPEESTVWLLHAIQGEDWMTSNLAMDSLINSQHLNSDDLISVYNKAEVREEIQWRIVFVLGQRQEAEFIPILVEALQNERWLVNNEAAVGLTRLNQKVVLKEIAALKKDQRLFVRNNVDWLIKQMKK